jgi:calcineurin-like phosphoesterase family protein
VGFLRGYIHGTTKRGDHGIHVGLDAWDLTPVSIDIIAQILNEPN